MFYYKYYKGLLFCEHFLNILPVIKTEVTLTTSQCHNNIIINLNSYAQV